MERRRGPGVGPRLQGSRNLVLAGSSVACVGPGCRVKGYPAIPATGSVEGPLGRTERLDLAAIRPAPGLAGGASSLPACVPGRGSEPAGRRNRPPEHRHEAGRRGPSDGGSRMPLDQGVKTAVKEP